METTGAVIVAAGRGSRMGTRESKQFLPLRGKPVLALTVELFERIKEIEEIVLVVGEQDCSRCEAYAQTYGWRKVRRIMAGGAERQDSVYRGLQGLSPGVDWVLIHDGVRPFVTPEKIKSCREAALTYGAAVLAVQTKDTIKLVDDTGRIVSTPDRRSLWAVQTPQAFRLSLIREAHERARAAQFTGTDDATLVERMGHPVQIVEGDYRNIKLTTQEDLLWATWLLEHGEGN